MRQRRRAHAAPLGALIIANLLLIPHPAAAGPPDTPPAPIPIRGPEPIQPLYTPENLPPRIALSLDPVKMWNELPHPFAGAIAGPDGRVWFSMEDPPGIPTLPAAHALIQREFNQPQPQLPFIFPVLFEPSGRVWFYARTSPDGFAVDGTLIAYDGKNFIEHAKLEARRFPMPAESAGRLGPANAAFADGHAFFLGMDEVHVFDGSAWTSREVAGGPSNAYLPRAGLYVDPDGKGVVAAPQDADQPLFRWRAGEWTRINLPREDGDTANNARPIKAVVPTADGIWILERRLRFISYKPHTVEWPGATSTSDLINQVQNGKPDERQAATEQLIAAGRDALPAITKAINAIKDRQQAAALNAVRSKLLDLPEVSLGKYGLSNVSFLYPLGDGRILVGGRRFFPRDQRDRAVEPADPPDRDAPIAPPKPDAEIVLIEKTTGQFQQLGGSDLFHQLAGKPSRASISTMPPLLVDNATKLWTPGDFESVKPALIDLATGKTLDTAPMFAVHSVAAVTRDNFILLEMLDRHILAYRADGKNEPAIKPISHIENAGEGTLTGDGAYWYLQVDEKNKRAPSATLVRYAGKDSRQFPELPLPPNTITFTPGYDGILFHVGQNWILVSPRGIIKDSIFEDLVAAHAKEFAQAFAGSSPRHPNSTMKIVQPDPSGNIWVLDKSRHDLKVFTDQKWLNCDDALGEAGIRDAAPHFLAAIGKSDKLLVSAYAGNRGPIPGPRYQPTFLIGLKDGKITAQSITDNVLEADPTGRALLDTQGQLWIAVDAGKNKPYIDWSSRAITDHGPGDTITWGVPQLCDTSGNLWVRQWLHTGQREWRVYKGDSFLDIPQYDVQLSEGYAICPGGCVAFVSQLGIHRLKVSQNAGKLELTANSITPLDGLPSRIERADISPLGFAAIIASNPKITRNGSDLYLYPLEAPAAPLPPK